MTPPFTGDVRQWATAMRRYLDLVRSQLAYRVGTTSRVNNGVILWDAEERVGVVSHSEQYERMSMVAAYVQLESDYTLSNTTDPQRLFNIESAGAVTLPVGRYLFETMFALTSMSSSSGNVGFQLAGTASLDHLLWRTLGIDNNPPTAVGAYSGQFQNDTASNANTITATTDTGAAIEIKGAFEVTAEGTVIPQIALADAAAAVVAEGSYIVIKRVAHDNTFGAWS